MTKIKTVKKAGKSLISRGNPTVEAEIFLNRISTSAISIKVHQSGTFEAHDCRSR